MLPSSSRCTRPAPPPPGRRGCDSRGRGGPLVRALSVSAAAPARRSPEARAAPSRRSSRRPRSPQRSPRSSAPGLANRRLRQLPGDSGPATVARTLPPPARSRPRRPQPRVVGGRHIGVVESCPLAARGSGTSRRSAASPGRRDATRGHDATEAIASREAEEQRRARSQAAFRDHRQHGLALREPRSATAHPRSRASARAPVLPNPLPNRPIAAQRLGTGWRRTSL